MPDAPELSEFPWLRLVRAAPEPVSPELALVSPELAATVRPTPDAVVVGPESAADAEPQEERHDGSGGEGPRGSARYDTADLLLERHGLGLELESRGSRRLWRLTLALGEVVEVWSDDERVPSRIEALLRALAGDEELRRVPARSDDPQVKRLQKRVRAQRRSLLAHDAGVRLAADPENLHQLRVASRRLRAFLRVAREHVDGAWAAEIEQVLRDVGRVSGPARDLDVLLEHLREQVATLEPRDHEAAAELIVALERDRADLQRGLIEVLDGEPYRVLLEQLGVPVETAPEPGARTLEQLAARELGKLVVRVRRLGSSPPDEQLHALRIRVKRVRYAAELAGGSAGARSARVIAAAALLQDVLGAHRDAAVAEERIRALAYRIGSPQIAFVAGRLAERQRQRRDELQQRLPAAWKRLRKLAAKSP
jgi:CHAD domain-containing protein